MTTYLRKGGSPRQYLADVALNPRDFVKMNAATGRVMKCTDVDTACLGMCISIASAAGATVEVVEAYPGVGFEIGITGTFTQANLGKYFNMKLASGVFTVDLTSQTARLLKLTAYKTDAKGNPYAIVEVAYAKSQALIEVA